MNFNPIKVTKGLEFTLLISYAVMKSTLSDWPSQDKHLCKSTHYHEIGDTK